MSAFDLLSSFNQSFSSFSPLAPICLHSFKISLGISKGRCDHLNFFLTSLISSSPKGDPWEEDFPDLLGDPNPITVLHEIKVGLFDLLAFLIAVLICFSLCPFISMKFHP